MPRGLVFPDVARLQRGLVLRGWTAVVLAERAGISVGAAYRAVAGKTVAIETSERIVRTLVENPADAALVAFFREEAG